MKRVGLVACAWVAVWCPAVVGAQEPAAPVESPATPPPAVAAEAATAPRAAVFELVGERVEPAVARLLTEAVVAELRRSGRFSHLVSSSDMEAMLGLERQKQLMSCTQDSCMAEMAGALGVDFLVLGKVGELGGTYLVTVKALDIKAARMSGSVVKRTGGQGRLPEVTALATYELMASAGLLAEGATPPGQEQVVAEPSGGGTAAGENPAKGGGNGGAGPRLPLVGAGVAVLVAGTLAVPAVLLLVGAAVGAVVVPYYVAYVPTPGLPYAARAVVFPAASTVLGVLAAVVTLVSVVLVTAGLGGLVAGFVL